MKSKWIMGGAALAMATLLSAATAHAGQWVYVSGGDSYYVGVDVSSIRTATAQYGQKPRLSAWTVYVSRELNLDHDVMYDYFVSRTIVDCSSFSRSTGQTAFYLIGGVRPINTDGGSPDSFSEPLPDSLGESVVDAVCDPSSYSSSANVETAADFALAARRAWEKLSAED